jgi:hypothetical protein
MILPLKSRRKRRKEKELERAWTVCLDRESAELLERLKEKMDRFRPMDENTLVRVALLGLEKKLDRIIERQLRKRVRTLKKKGFNAQEIARQLNAQGIPAKDGLKEWDPHTVLDFFKE